MEDTTASSVVRFFKNDSGKTSKTLGLVVSIHAISSGRPKRNNSKFVKTAQQKIYFQRYFVSKICQICHKNNIFLW